MRTAQIFGALLVVGGLFILNKGATYPSDQSLFKVGNVEAKVERQRAVPPWIGGIALAAGIALVAVGSRKA